jgi:hypothetical protein
LLGRLNVLNDIIGDLPNNQLLLQIEGANIANFYVTNQNQPGNVLRVDK